MKQDKNKYVLSVNMHLKAKEKFEEIRHAEIKHILSVIKKRYTKFQKTLP